MSRDDYCFVAFSGHGEDGSVVLNDSYQQFSTSGLRPKSDRGVVVIDSCRGISSVRTAFNEKSTALANSAYGSIIAKNAREGRSTRISEQTVFNRLRTFSASQSLWEQRIAKTTGIVEMLACAKGQGAGEDPNAGGYYTSLLLSAADAWNKRTTAENIFTTRNAHDEAASMLPPQQTPEYSPSWLAYPFALKS